MIEVDLATERTRYFGSLSEALNYCLDIRPESLAIQQGITSTGTSVYVLTYRAGSHFDE